jgi:glycerophosphoryl diester phosphodiesterase
MHSLTIIAHRGASYDAPENTLPAYKLAWQQGADGIEGDFRLTADGQIVCLHDPSTGRVGDRDLVVSESTLAELRQVDMGIVKGEEWTGTRIPTLAEILALVPEGKRIYIEIKSGLAIVEPLEKALAESGLRPEQIVLISFVGNVISGVKKKMPQYKAHLLSVFPEDKSGKVGTTGLIQRVKTLNADGADVCAHPGLDQAFVQAFHQAGLECHVWTVDDPLIAKQLAEAGVASITTNRPGMLRGEVIP